MANTAPPDNIEIVPASIPEARPYADAVFTFVGGHDVTLVFMRTPLIRAEDAMKQVKNGRFEAPAVSSITLPKTTALELADAIKRMLGGS